MLKKETFWKLIIALSVVDIFSASYLFYNYLTKPVVETCYISQKVNCDAVTKGSLAKVFGIPVSLIGLIGYLIILGSALLKKQKLLLAISTFGLLFCLSITYQELFNLKIICPVCLICQTVMALIFLLAILINFHPALQEHN